jgi:predicted nuclease of predicted toxin-antitoxin system
MKWAAEHGCVVLTADLDFSALLAASQGTRPSVVQIRSDLLAPSSIGALVLRTVRLVEARIERRAIVSVDTAGARLRILPLVPR